MAGDSYVSATFSEADDEIGSGVSVFFEFGLVTSIVDSEGNGKTNILGCKSRPTEIEMLYGKPRLISNAFGVTSAIQWKYPNGVSYNFWKTTLRSVTASKEVWNEFQKPDWGITITDSSGSTSGIRGSSSYSSSTVKGIVKNDRESAVSVVLRVRWSNQPSGRFADAYDSQPIQISPHDDAVFEISGGSIIKPDKGEALVYDVKVKSVTEP
jgi:hypothetical protein